MRRATLKAPLREGGGKYPRRAYSRGENANPNGFFARYPMKNDVYEMKKRLRLELNVIKLRKEPSSEMDLALFLRKKLKKF